MVLINVSSPATKEIMGTIASAVSLLVTTSNQTPIPQADVSIDGNPSVSTTPNGTLVLSPSNDPFTLKISMPNYVTQTVTVQFESSANSYQWDDPGTTLTQTAQPAAKLTMTVRLGRMKPAPSIPFDPNMLELTPKELEAIPKNAAGKHFDQTKTIENPQQTFVWPDGSYYFIPQYPPKFIKSPQTPNLFELGNLQSCNFYSATSEMLTNNTRDPKATGWDSFNYGSLESEIQGLGDFTYVEWASPDSTKRPNGAQYNRYLVGLWRPRASEGTPSDTEDAIVFFTPPTRQPPKGRFLPDQAPYVKNYPYALNQWNVAAPAVLTQAYVDLGARYLWGDKFISHQILAAKKDALFVIPIQPSTHWEDFQNVEGVSRLLSEAFLFEHRQGLQRQTAIGKPPPKPDKFALQSPTPALGVVAVAGYSRGIQNVRDLAMKSSNYRASQRTWPSEIVNPYLADATAFLKAWREIWDFDGVLDESPASWRSKLNTWQRVSSHLVQGKTDRAIRLYHTQASHWTSEIAGAARPFVGTPVSSKVSNAKVREYHGPTGDVVWLANSLIYGNSPAAGEWAVAPHSETDYFPDRPRFWGRPGAKDPSFWAHQDCLKIFVAHAASRSQLRKI